jgi:SAM-dependent methyltransferase
MDIYSAILNLPGHTESEVFNCSQCGVSFLWPYIADYQLSEVYSRSYFTGEEGSFDHFMIPGSGVNYEESFAAARVQKFVVTIKKLFEYVPNARSILDIGAASGEFLAIARDTGLSISGIELSSYAASRAKEKYGFELHKVRFENYTGAEKYDLIHTNHVFEHFAAPHKALDHIASLLNPGGMVYVEVPFQFSVFEVIKYLLTRKRKTFDIFSVHHPVFYRPRSLRKLFAIHSFNCRQMRVFDWSRYPVTGVGDRLKRLIWFAASLVGQGIMIEAFFQKEI